MDTWFTADSHFSHTNIIKYSNRPYNSIEQMDNDIIDRWNKKLKPGDRLFILGDFCGQRRRPEILKSYLERIHLNKDGIFLIKGNHDDKQHSPKAFKHVYDIYEYKHTNKQIIVLFHYAMKVWNRCHYGSWSLFGHSHGNLLDDPNLRSIDVGVDPNGFELLSFDDVAQKMLLKTFKPVDHHVSGE